MASTLHDIKEKLSTTKAAPNHPVGDSVAPPESKQEAPSQGGEGQSFNILPHPAKSNDPADLQKPSENTGGLQSSQGAFSAFRSVPGPVIPNQEALKNLPPPKTQEELNALQAQLNK